MKYRILSFLFLLASVTVLAQTKISGHIYDESNEPIAYANVYFQGTSIGTITDENGTYYLEDDGNHDTVVFSFISYVTQTVPLKQKVTYDFDIVLIQEIVGKDPAGIQAVAKIIDELNRLGSKWDYYVSNPTKSPSAKMSERYGFLWKTSKISVKGKPYLDLELENLCYREPYIGNFTLKNQSKTITLVNYHSRKYDDSPEEEIIHLKNYKERLESESIIIAGDFNLDEQQPVWDNFYSRGFLNALENTPTTLKTKCKSGNYLNHSIDNIYYTPKIKVIESGSLDFVKTCDNLSEARNLSDHLPVYIRFQ